MGPTTYNSILKTNDPHRKRKTRIVDKLVEYFFLFSKKMFNIPSKTFAPSYLWYADALKLIEVAANWKLGEENGNFAFLFPIILNNPRNSGYVRLTLSPTQPNTVCV